MGKCIILSRVSTTAQDLTEQTNELLTEASRNGYSKDQCIIIERKESAIKNNVSERQSIQELFNAIETENIDLVLCRELSRLARRADVLYTIRDFLINHKANLIILQPYMRLLDNEGNLTQASNIMFSLFGAISESEMQIKKERFKEGKQKKQREGYKIYSRLSFGYTTDENHKIIVNQSEAAIVRRIYNLYGDYSVSQIQSELSKLGYNFTNKRINLILHNKEYISQATDKYGQPMPFPRILTDELFYAVQDKLKANYKEAKERIYSLAAKLIICPCCGRHFKQIGRNYVCVNHSQTAPANYCDCEINISVKRIDELTWKLTKAAQTKELSLQSANEKKYIKQTIKDLNKQLETTNKAINNITNRKNKLATAYIDELITEAEYRKRLDKIKTDAESLVKNHDYIAQQIINQQDMLDSFVESKPSAIKQLRQALANDDMKQEDKYKLTHKYVKQIIINKLQDKARAIEIQSVNNIIHRYLFIGLGRAFRIKTNSEIEFYNKSFTDLTIDDFTETL